MICSFKEKGGVWLSGLAASLLFLGVPARAQIGNGLVAYWNFDSENFQDSVGIFHGTPEGDVPIGFIQSRPGFGRAIQLLGPSDSGGANQHVVITGGDPDDLAFAGGSLTVSAWFRTDGWDKSWQALVAKGEGDNWRIHRRGEENVMGFTGGNGGDTPSGTTAVNDGQWHHLVAISDAGTQTSSLWIDGALDAQRDIGALTANGLRMMIGENPAARNRYWRGPIDDVAIWNRPLTPTEIGQLWNNGEGTALRDLLGDQEADTDGDGMPDWWEELYGLNPNDPADAALDCNGNGMTNLESFLAGLDPCDATPPTIVSGATTATFNRIILTFSEDLDPATAGNVANYSISPALAVSAAAYNRREVTLTTATQAPQTAYTVTVTDVTDLAKNAVAPDTRITVFSYMLTREGVLKFSYWGGITGTAVDLLLADPRYPNSPDWVGAVYSFNSRDILPTDSNDNYGATIEGYISPTVTGSYDFFLRSDDASELWISTDESPANLNLWAWELGCCQAFLEPGANQTSWMPLALQAGRKYFIRVIYKEGGGGDYAQVAWRREGDTTPAASLQPIPGLYLSAASDVPVPSEGTYVSRTPAPNARNVLPNTAVTIVHRDGLVPWTAANVSLRFNGVAVTPTVTKEGSVATITYQPPLLPSGSLQTVTLGHPDPAGQPTTTEWSFETAAYVGPLLDNVAGYPALLMGAANLTADQGGRTGAPGDLALDTGVSAGVGFVPDATFLNAATADDKLTIAFFQKIRSVRNSSSVWANSPSSPSSSRGFQAHVPWSDSTIYFDTSGCCDADVTRINSNINNFSGFTGDAWWQQWHHFAFVKDGAEKRIYIDGQLFHWGGGIPLRTDFTTLIIGGGPGIADNRIDGMLDDFVIYNGALSDAQASSLAGGANPNAIPGLIAHWDFNELPPAAVTLTAVRVGLQVTITSEPAALPAGWVLQTAPSVNGPWTTQQGATTPITVNIGEGNAFLRAARP